MRIPIQFQSFRTKAWLLFFTFQHQYCFYFFWEGISFFLFSFLRKRGYFNINTNACITNSKSYVRPMAYWMTSIITNSPLHGHTRIERLNFKNSWWDKLLKIISCSKDEWISGLFISSRWIALIVVCLGEKPNKA